MRRSLGCAFALMLVLGVACARGEDVVRPEAAAARVGQLLYADNLIADAEVNERVGRYIAAVDRDGALPDSVLPALHEWLEEWVARHPERAARARMMPHGSQPTIPAARQRQGSEAQ